MVKAGKHILGLMNFGGSAYYSDGPPWATPTSMAEEAFGWRKGPAGAGSRDKIKATKIENVAESTYEKALALEQAWDHVSQSYR